jgi:hypothetical protein
MKWYTPCVFVFEASPTTQSIEHGMSQHKKQVMYHFKQQTKRVLHKMVHPLLFRVALYKGPSLACSICCMGHFVICWGLSVS